MQLTISKSEALDDQIIEQVMSWHLVFDVFPVHYAETKADATKTKIKCEPPK